MLRGATPDEAEDVLQEVSLNLSRDGIGRVDQPRAYLYRAASNQLLLHRRAAGRRVQRERDWVDAQSGEGREVDDRPSAEAQMIAREQLVVLQAVLDGLPERTRTIFRRFRLNGEPQRQIAADLGVSVSAVEKHLTRAYEAIADARLRLDGDRAGLRSLKDKRGRYAF
jgi:RNA polymerase sigma-70 factor (ECF subfamily)